MGIKELLKGDIINYTQDGAERISHAPWLFIHVPETVPFKFREQLADVAQPDLVINPDESLSGDYDTRMGMTLQRLSFSKEFQSSRFVSGHFKVLHLEAAQLLGRVRLLTILKDPLDRLLADYAAQQKNELSPSGFLDFAKKPANQNVYNQCLCPKGFWRPKDCIDYIIEHFDFIGLAEDLNMSLKLFYSLRAARPSAIAVQPEAAFARAQVPVQTIKAIARLNALDYEIYRYLHDGFVGLRERFFALHDFGEIFRRVSFREQ